MTRKTTRPLTRTVEQVQVQDQDQDEDLSLTIEKHQFWHRDVGVGNLGALMTSKMVIVRQRTVTIYDFWPDKDDEVMEDIGEILDLFLKHLKLE